MTRAQILFVAVSLLAGFGVSARIDAQQPRWYRGNTHTHTRGADVDANSDQVAQWYRTHGYDFIVVTDHEFLTDVAPLNAAHGDGGKFLLISGQEVTQIVADPTHPDKLRHAHVNGIGSRTVVKPISTPGTSSRWNPILATATTMTEAYARNMSEIRAAGGLPQVNHPNYQWSVRLDDLLPLADPYLLEVWNGYPTSNNRGGVDDAGNVSPSGEGLWDGLLSRGKVVWGVASDDSHTYTKFDNREVPSPGKGWIVVRARSLTAEAITQAIRRGDFYASTGVALERLDAGPKEMAIGIEQPPDPSGQFHRPTRYTTRFVGAGGKLLAELNGLTPRYRIRGDEGYVRASIVDSDGRQAWTQPHFLDGRATERRGSATASPTISVDAEGTVRLPAFDVPYSSLASDGARRNFIDVTAPGARNPVPPGVSDIDEVRTALDEQRMRPAVERLRSIFPVTITPNVIAGIHTDIVEPAGGVSQKNRTRVLINLHGGGFSVGARYGGQQESIPVASLGAFKVVTVDYRMGPEHTFPAASEDVAAVYKALLIQHRPDEIGIYGCSAGGMLAAQAVAWLHRQGLPRPGAVGIFGAGALVGKGGDSSFVSAFLNARGPAVVGGDEAIKRGPAYFRDADFADPLVSPAYAPAVLEAFPPTLVISGTRDDLLSDAVYTHAQLVKAGVDADLHVWEGATHCSFAQPLGNPDFPENREAWKVIVTFFDRHLGRAQ
jgi:monoterpene epsilon-lactone hydrolase